MNLVGPLTSGAAVGGDGEATANETSTVNVIGRVQGIYVKYNGSPPATTDVTIATLGTAPSAPTYNLLALTDANTDGWFYPRVQVHDTAGSAIAAEYTPLIVYDRIKVTIAQVNAADYADVWLLIDDYSTDQ